MFDFRELPDEIHAATAMAMITEHPRLQGIFEALMDHIYEQEDAKDLKEKHDHLVGAFTKAPPDFLEDEDIDPEVAAKAFVGLGMINTIYSEYGDFLQQTLHAIVDGTREIIKNVAGFTEENI